MIEPSLLTLVPPEQALDMPDLINDVIASGMRVGGFPIHEYWLDIGRPNELRQARSEFTKDKEGSGE